eukprot:31309_1
MHDMAAIHHVITVIVQPGEPILLPLSDALYTHAGLTGIREIRKVLCDELPHHKQNFAAHRACPYEPVALDENPNKRKKHHAKDGNVGQTLHIVPGVLCKR